MTFDNRIDYKYYYDNYMYNREKVKQVSVLKTYNVTVKLGIIYTNTAKYFDFLFFSKHQRLLIKNPPKSPKIVAK